MKRWIALLAAVGMQTCMGGVYAWSVFVPPLRALHGFSAAESQLVFGTTIAVFTLAMVFAGRLLPVWGARRTASLGGVLFAAGYTVASLGGGDFASVFWGVGVLSGGGIGFGYVSALTTGMRWFPQHKGLATGCSVAGFGSGAVLLSAGVSRLLLAGFDVPRIFGLIGLVYGALVLAGASLLFKPPADVLTATALPPGKSLFRDARFGLLALGLFAGTFAGLLVVGNLKPIGLSRAVPQPIALLAISVLAVGNAAGRLIWGWLSDWLGFRAIPLSLLLLAGSIGGLYATAPWPEFYLFFAFLTGAGFGACFVVYAAEVARVFGSRGIGKVYPILFLTYGLSGILGPPTGGWIYDLLGSFRLGVVLSIGLLGIAFAVVWMGRSRMVMAEADVLDVA